MKHLILIAAACLAATAGSAETYRTGLAELTIADETRPLTGFVWYDTNSTHWLAPEKQAARQYVTDLVTECAQMGFDELLLDDFHYPREGRLSRIKTDERTMTQQEALMLLSSRRA